MVESISTAAAMMPITCTPTVVQAVAELLQASASKLGERLADIIEPYNDASLSPALIQVVKHDPRWGEAMEEYAQADVHVLEAELSARQRFTHQLMALLAEWQTNVNQRRLSKIQTIWDKNNWFAKLDRHETVKILGRQQHRLLVLTSPPEISLDCPLSFHHNLTTEIRNGMGAFLGNYYPLGETHHTESLYPVEFYGDYFREPIFDRDVMQLQTLLSSIPTAVLYSDITDYQVNFHLGFWGVQNAVVAHFSLPPWNWEAAYLALQETEGNETQVLRIIRQIIVVIHQLVAAFVADWYYLQINPLHVPQLSHLQSQFPTEWVQSYVDVLDEIYHQNQAQLLYDKGSRLANLGDHQQAIACFDQALTLQPQFGAATIARGIALYNCQRYEEAANCLANALETQPESDEAWYYRGVALSSLGHYHNALGCFEKVTRLKSEQPEGWLGLGDTLYQLQRYGEAVQAYNRAITLRPDFKVALKNRESASKKYWLNCTEASTFTGHSAPVIFLAFSPDSQLLASGCSGGQDTLKIWSLPTGSELHTLTPHFSWVHAVTYSHKSQLLAISSEENMLELWSTATGEKLYSLSGHTDWIHAIAFSPDCELLASGSADKSIKIWSTATGKKLRTFTGHTNWVSAIAFSPNSQFLASGSADNSVKLWSLATWEKLRHLTGHSDWMRSMPALGDTNITDPYAHRGFQVTWKELHTYTGHTDLVHAIAFSPDSRHLASGSWDFTIKLWSVTSGKELGTLTGHAGRIYSLAFSPDGRYIASASADKTVKIWSTTTGKNLRTLSLHFDQAMSIAFSPDGRYLACGSHDKTIKIWRCQ